jgi:hypothetical protein
MGNEKLKRILVGRFSVGGCGLVKTVLKKCDTRVWTGLIWLGTETSCGLL